MPQYRFPSAHAAYCWAYEILDVWRGGRGPNSEQYGGGTGAMGAVVAALSVEMIADKYDPGIDRQPHPAIKPRDRAQSWFVQALVSQLEPRHFSPSEKWQLDIALCRFCLELHDKGMAEKGGCKAKCPGNKTRLASP